MTRQVGNHSLHGTVDRHRRGIALIWVALLSIVLIGVVGLGVDTARVLLVSHELQNASDAAALAGAHYVRNNALQARTAVIAAAAANYAEGVSIQVTDNAANASNGQIVIGQYDQSTGTFTATLVAPNAVRVVTQRSAANSNSLPLIFGPIFGVTVSNITRHSIAMVGGGTGAGLLTLGTAGTGVSVGGTANLTVNGGGIVVDSSSTTAVTTNGNTALITANGLNVVGNTSVGPPNYTGTIKTGAPSVADPLSFLPTPSSAGMPDQGTISNKGNKSITINPGYYSGGISMNNGSITMNPGVYIVDGAGLNINGGNLTANGVMIYVKGSGSVSLGGNGNIVITPIPSTDSADATYNGMAIFQDRSDANAASIIGNNNTSSITGTLYFPDNAVSLGGTGDFTAGNQLIAKSVSVSGTGDITIVYDGRNPAPGNVVYLVQ